MPEYEGERFSYTKSGMAKYKRAKKKGTVRKKKNKPPKKKQ
jgi:hypothetical protein